LFSRSRWQFPVLVLKAFTATLIVFAFIGSSFALFFGLISHQNFNVRRGNIKKYKILYKSSRDLDAKC